MKIVPQAICILLLVTGAGVCAAAAEPRVLRVGVEANDRPVAFLDSQHRPMGFTIDVLRQMESQGAITFVIVPGYWRTLTDEFAKGHLDVLADIEVSDSRRKTMDFSIAHAHIHAVTLTRDGDEPITRTSQFRGKVIGILMGSTADINATANGLWGTRIRLISSWPRVLSSVRQGDCDFALVANPSKYGPADMGGLRANYVNDLEYRYHMAVHHGDQDALDRINEALAAMKEDDTFDRLYSKWIGPIEPRPILITDLRRYYWPSAAVLILIVSIFAWQQRVKREVVRQSVALRISEDKYRALFESAKDGILILDAATGMIVDANPFLVQLLGFPREQFLGKRIWDLKSFRDLVADLASFEHWEGRNYIHYDDKPLETGDGRRIAVEFVSNVYMVAGKKVIQCNIRDITERKKADEGVRKLSRIIDQAPLSVVITDLSGTIEYVNARFCAVTGYSTEEAIGKNPRILKSGDTPPAVYRAMWDNLVRGKTWNGELRNRKKDGEIYLETVVIAPVDDASGRTTHYVAFKDDISAKQRLAEESEARLRKEKEISEMKSHFISMISHEFRTPLTAAMASAELLHHHADRLTPAKREEHFARINSSVNRLTYMLDEILALNRAESARSTLEFEPVNVRLFLHDLIDEVRAGDRDAHPIELSMPGEPGPFLSDLNLLRHILSNLLSNAVRYSPAGSPITVEAEVDSLRARFSFQDRGIGVPEADRQRIFEPFERGSNVGATEGTGLGLNIVKRMTEALGGKVGVEGPTRGGSRFTLVLPRPGTGELPL